MPFTDHFIYTTAKTEKGTGYQIIKKSKGITQEITSQLSDYLYPIGVQPNEFKESRSLLILEDDKIAYSIIKNIGIGYDGRDNTLYNHTFIISLADFKKLHYDSRIFENYFIEKSSIPEYLEPLQITAIEITPNVVSFEKLGLITLRSILYELFRKNKIALVNTDQVHLIQDILSVIPLSLRLISFSTLVNQPDRQYKYCFIQVSKQTQSKVDRSFKKIDHRELDDFSKNRPKTNFEEAISHLVNLILYQTRERIEKIYDDFEKIPNQDYQNKIILLVNYDLFETSNKQENKEKYAIHCFRAAEELSENIVEEYIIKIKDYLNSIDIIQYLSKIKNKELIHELDNTAITIKKIEKIFNMMENSNYDSRIKLLNDLIKERKIDFIKYGASILLDAVFSYSYYRDEITQVFVENKSLHHCVSEILYKKSKLTKKEKQDIFEKILRAAILYNPEFIEDLIRYPVFDLAVKDDSYNFKWLIDYIYNSSDFCHMSPIIILAITKKIRYMIQKVLNTQEKLNKNNQLRKNKDPINIRNLVHVANTILKCMQTIRQSNKNNVDSILQKQIDREVISLETLVRKGYELELKIQKKNLPTLHEPPKMLQDIINWIELWGRR